jgi:YggT family protein
VIDAYLIIGIVNLVFRLVSLLIFVRVILSWLPMVGVRIDPYHPLIRILFQLTDPILEPLRRFTTFGMIDFSPIAALILLDVVRFILISIIRSSL